MMEFSSPLAAMHRPEMSVWASSRDVPASGLAYYAGRHATIASSTFDFRELSKTKSNQDYFSMPPPARNAGSSPTVSLAADLSSNFHIDHSPHPPTPRRSLFPRDMFLDKMDKDVLLTPPVSTAGAITPPIVESSPAADAMDMSPLPHKAPCFVAHVTQPSSPASTIVQQEDQIMPLRNFASTAALPRDRPQPSLAAPMLERKRSTAMLQRPSLHRSKTTIPGHAQSTSGLLPAFQFGKHTSKLCNSSSISSNAEASATATTDSSGSPRVASSDMRRAASLNAASGSPISSIYRSAVVCGPRPRKQVRRSLSMFQHPNDVMNEPSDCSVPTPLSVAQQLNSPEPYKHRLPHALCDEPDSLPRIQQDTLINVIRGDYSAHYDKVMVVDCRFEYEYNGGHIDGAMNFNDKELLMKTLFENAAISARTLLVLHCEYSVHRAPRMAKYIRAQDRNYNAAQYPHLSYPEMYILEGGYSMFFKQNRSLCFPQNYVEMEHKDYEQACERGMGKLKQRAKLNRAQTFAFGQQHCAAEQSPTSSCAMSFEAPIRSIDHDLSPMVVRNLARRLASY